MNAQVITAPMHEDKLPSPEKVGIATDQAGSRSIVSLFFILLIASLCIFSVWRLLEPTTLPIKHVRIEGNFQHLSPDRMKSLVKDVVRGGFFNLNVASINRALLNEPWVHWVSVQRIWPDGLNVQVKEQIAIAHWNGSALLNPGAQIFSPQEAMQISALPFLSGPDGTQALLLERYNHIRQAVSNFSLRIDSISLSERRAWQIQLIDGPLVILGRSDIDSRINRFSHSVLNSLAADLSKIKNIDMRYPNGFAVEWINSSTQIDESRLENNG